MNILLELIDGAKAAKGLTVIIDVFRAMTVEAYVIQNGAAEMLTGSLVNAKAIAAYIKASGAEDVSLVCMSLAGKESTWEDTLCAEYIKALVEGTSIDLAAGIEECKRTSGAKFFDPNNPIFPEEDFWLSVEADKFDFVLHVEKGSDGLMHTIRK